MTDFYQLNEEIAKLIHSNVRFDSEFADVLVMDFRKYPEKRIDAILTGSQWDHTSHRNCTLLLSYEDRKREFDPQTSLIVRHPAMTDIKHFSLFQSRNNGYTAARDIESWFYSYDPIRKEQLLFKVIDQLLFGRFFFIRYESVGEFETTWEYVVLAEELKEFAKQEVFIRYLFNLDTEQLQEIHNGQIDNARNRR